MAFTFVVFAYLIALFAVVFCVFCAINTLIAIDELKNDYKNPIDQCKSLNKLVLPEYVIHFAFTLLFMASAQMIAVIMNVPLAIYHLYTYTRRPMMSSRGIYDPTTIMNRDRLSAAVRTGWVTTIFYIVSFMYYLFGLIYSLIAAS